MNVAILSRDPDLHKLCNDIASDYGTELRLLVWPAADAKPDLCIWDFEPVADLPCELGEHPFRDLFLSRREDVPSLRDRVGKAAPNIILKPVNRSTLSAFFGM